LKTAGSPSSSEGSEGGTPLRDHKKDTAVKKALISGITGRDGSYLTEILLDRGYEVHGIIRRSSTSGRRNRLGTFRGYWQRTWI
jgi:hypothetical protein